MLKITKKTPTKKQNKPNKRKRSPPLAELVGKEKKLLQISHTDKNIKASPRKLRILANTVKKLKPDEALTRLKLTNSKSAKILYKNIKATIANVKNNSDLDLNTILFHSIQVDDSIKFKRMDKSHSSRFARGLIQKRHSRLKIIISAKIRN
ncbi:uL22 family ribosomal protein [Patescibacteria group bacterium]|nr:uL22 family ribosomal protein [Patescibacteria group bacterium]